MNCRWAGTEEAESAPYLKDDAYAPQKRGNNTRIHPHTHTSSAQDTTSRRPQHIGLKLQSNHKHILAYTHTHKNFMQFARCSTEDYVFCILARSITSVWWQTHPKSCPHATKYAHPIEIDGRKRTCLLTNSCWEQSTAQQEIKTSLLGTDVGFINCTVARLEAADVTALASETNKRWVCREKQALVINSRWQTFLNLNCHY